MRRERPEDRIAAFERMFRAIHVLIADPASDPGGPPEISPDIVLPTPAWTPAKLGPDQHGYLFSEAAVNVADAGRRSFKSQALFRRTVRAAITSDRKDGEFYLGGPTERQAKIRVWKPLKRLVPRWAMRGGSPRTAISEVDMQIDLWNGCFIRVAGLDKPERIEGGSWDGGGITEFGNCRPDVREHVDYMLVRPGAWIDYEGTPELGAVEYKRLSDSVRAGEVDGALRHHWSTEDVLHLWLGREEADKRLAQWKASSNGRIYDQEARGMWVTAGGRAYYEFDREVHAVDPAGLKYDPRRPLVFCFDFNVSPGVAVVVQELPNDQKRPGVGGWFTAILDEVWIADDSNTPRVVQQLLGSRWGRHAGPVVFSGDPAGGARGTAKESGTDWQIIGRLLSKHCGSSRVHDRVPKSAPLIRQRVNATNDRMRTADGTVRLLVNRECRHLIEDLEAVTFELLESSEQKRKAGDLTHLSDALSDFVWEEHGKRGGTRRVGGIG